MKDLSDLERARWQPATADDREVLVGDAVFGWQPSKGDRFVYRDRGDPEDLDPRLQGPGRARSARETELRVEYMSYGETRTRNGSTRWRPWCAPG